MAEGPVAQLEKEIITAQVVSQPELNSIEFEHDEFAGKYQNLSDFLQFNAGIQTRSSGTGNNVSLSIRGSTHLQIRLIIDGHEVNDAQYGGFDINKLPLQQINNIKIIKDNSEGVGGTIILNTLNPTSDLQSKAFSSVGSFETHEYGFTQYFSGYGHSAFNINRLYSKADYEYPVDSPFSDPGNSGRIEKLSNNEYQKNSLLYKWDKNSTRNSKTGIKIQLSKSKKNLPNYQQNRYDNQSFLSDRNLNLQAFIESDISKDFKNKVSVDHTKKDETYNDPYGFIGVGAYINEYTSRIQTLSNLSQLKLSQLSLSFDYIYKIEEFENNHTLVPDSVKCLQERSTCDIRSSQESQSLSFLGGWSTLNENHGFQFGSKILNLDKKQETLFSSPNIESDSNIYNTWNMSYSYHGMSASSVQLSLSKALRTPTLYELFGNRGLVKSNINLKPEQSKNININISSAYKSYTFENNLYLRNLDDAIIGQFSGGTGTYKNLSNAEILGLETKIASYFSNFTFSVISTLQDSHVKSEIHGFNNKKLAGIFHQSISTSINFHFDHDINITYQYQHDDNLYVDTANLEKHNGRFIHNIRANYSSHALQASFSIENFLDSRFKNNQNRPAPGLFLNSSIQYAF